MTQSRKDELIAYLRTPVPFGHWPKSRSRHPMGQPAREVYEKTNGGYRVTYWQSLPQYTDFPKALIAEMVEDGVLVPRGHSGLMYTLAKEQS